MDYSTIISPIVGIPSRQVAATILLLDDKATIPFIARYRKEKTGSLDEVQIAQISEQYTRLSALDERKETMLRTIEEQGKMTDELRRRIENCWDSTELEDIYLPYKPHRKTRADIAIEHGLEPLAHLILQQRISSPDNEAKRFLSKEVSTIEEALQGARDIIAEWISQDEKARNSIRREFGFSAILTTKKRTIPTAIKDEKQRTQWEKDAENYKDYFAVSEPLKRIAGHRLLAIRRAEKEGYIRVDISPNAENSLDKLANIYLRSKNDASYQVEMAIEDSYKRLLKPSIETEFALSSKEKADTEAIRVFADNLRQLLLDSPLGQKRVLALDPGFRTGCKLVVLNEQGDLVDHTVVYIRMAESAVKLLQLVKKYKIEAIAIGNGTASRECEEFVRDTLQGAECQPAIFVVSENGASVYSASKIAREEFPNEDVTVRGAISIGRRLMDPLAELVKIDPKSIGVGQYQHDVDQSKLKESLSKIVESVVNYVGVDVNTASTHLLTYISGLGPTLAQNIVHYRQENGPFLRRKDFLLVPKMGTKTYELAAGFLRITNAENPLDNSAVHPERYALVEQMANDLHCTVKQLMEDAKLRQQIDLQHYVSSEVGMPTLTDIMNELEKPSRDPRQQLEEFHFSSEVHCFEDLKVGMTLPGIVTNIAAFGAFVDIGVHKDGLIHISEMANRRVNNPSEVVSLHQHVVVRIIEIDTQRKRIQLSLK